MSTALATFKLRETRPKQHLAGVGAAAGAYVLAVNEIIRDVLPPIVAELEKKINDLQEKVNNMKRPAGSALSAVHGLRGGRRTRRARRL